MNQAQTKTDYDEWVSQIARSRSADEFIAHFREHVGEHYLRHEREGELSMFVWMVGVLNFLHIFEKLFPEITYEDLLYKLCRHHINCPGGSDPPFDMEKFLAEYAGPVSMFHREEVPVTSH